LLLNKAIFIQEIK